MGCSPGAALDCDGPLCSEGANAHRRWRSKVGWRYPSRASPPGIGRRPGRVRVLPAEAAWQLDPAGAAGDIALVETSHALEVVPQRLPEDPGEDRDPVLVALAGPDDDAACLEVDVLHAKPGALEQPQAGAVE